MSVAHATPPALARLAAAAPAADWRREALARLSALGLPTARDDAFKHTNVRLLERRDLLPAAARPFDAGRLAALPERRGATLVFVDGRRSPALDGGTLPAGVGLRPLAELPHGERLDACDAAGDRLRLLNAALGADGGELTVAPGTRVADPIHVVYATTGAGGAYPRLLVTVGARAALTLVEHHLGGGDADGVSVPVTDVELGEEAQLEQYGIASAGPRHLELDQLSVRLAPRAVFRHHQLTFGGQLARLDLRVALAGDGAEARLAGLLLADGSRHAEVRTVVDHRTPHTTSSQLYRGVAGDRARAGYDGKVIVRAGAVRSSSRQSCRHLLLSPTAAADARPQLEINADDVQCSHGATTGALDEAMLFYMLSRGIDRATAQGLLTFAFAGEVLAAIGLPELRHEAERRMLGSLPSADLIREFVR